MGALIGDKNIVRPVDNYGIGKNKSAGGCCDNPRSGIDSAHDIIKDVGDIHIVRAVEDISIHSLHKISKYNGKEGTAPKIHKLGSGTWAKTKAKTKTKVKKIAYDLIKLYAKRKEQKGFACGPDSYLQLELEASFIYEDTPDQEKATEMIKEDMQKEMPMDRLVCGDVGFGKTELAVRAAFSRYTSARISLSNKAPCFSRAELSTPNRRHSATPCNSSQLSPPSSSRRSKRR